MNLHDVEQILRTQLRTPLLSQKEREKERTGADGDSGGGCRNKRCPHYDGMFLK